MAPPQSWLNKPIIRECGWNGYATVELCALYAEQWVAEIRKEPKHAGARARITWRVFQKRNITVLDDDGNDTGARIVGPPLYRWYWEIR